MILSFEHFNTWDKLTKTYNIINTQMYTINTWDKLTKTYIINTQMYTINTWDNLLKHI